MMTGDVATCFSKSLAFEDCFLTQTLRIFLMIGLVSPVIELSSMVMSLDYMRIPSAGISMPSVTLTISPTSTKS